MPNGGLIACDVAADFAITAGRPARSTTRPRVASPSGLIRAYPLFLCIQPGTDLTFQPETTLPRIPHTSVLAYPQYFVPLKTAWHRFNHPARDYITQNPPYLY